MSWIDYIRSNFGERTAQQFERAAQRTASSNLFIQTLLAKEAKLIRPDEYYFGLADRMNVSGRNDDDARDVGLQLIDGEIVDWSRFQFLTNPLLPVPKDHPDYGSPSRRVVCGPSHIFTYEFDEKDHTFFVQQCSWFRYRNRDTNCELGQLYEDLSDYADFVGIVACYSGNKSFHIHCVFDPTLADHAYKLADDADVDLRTGFMAHWHTLKEDVLRVLKPTLNGQIIEPDAQLQHPEWYRRLPGGTRVIQPKPAKPDWKHALGMPFGTRVPQVIMWQKFRKQAGEDASALFFRPCPFRSEKAKKARERNAKAAVMSHDGFSTDEFAFIDAKMREHYPANTYPEFVTFEKDRGVWLARFRNGPTDRNPSSIMRHDHNTVLMMGQGAGVITQKPLQLPLLTMMRFWKDQYHRMLEASEKAPPISTHDEEGEDEEFELIVDAKHVPGNSLLEQEFVASATDIQATGKATRRFFRSALVDHQCLLVKGPEGGGKSSAITKLHDGIIRWLSARGKPILSMYCFTDYVNAEQKCEAFNQREEERQARRGQKRWGDRNYRGVILKSFSRVYSDARAALGYKEITPLIAAQVGCKSIWEAVAQHQPEAMDYFREEHRKFWEEIGTATPVLFAVHAVAHAWRTGTPTRTMWAKEFWNQGANPSDWQHRQATDLGLLVHDEIKHTDIVDIRPAEIVEWTEAMMQTDFSAWSNRQPALAEQFESYNRHVKACGHPVVNGQTVRVAFDEARTMISGGMLDWREVTLSEKGAYPDNNPKKLLYTAPIVNGHRWMVRTKYWWRDHRTPTGRISQSQLRVADRVIILTTEELPTAVLRVADPICWKTYSLETPHLGRDHVDVETDRSITANNVAKTAQKHRDRLGGSIAVISNKAKFLKGVQTPISARGSNEYIGQDVLQTMMFMAPEMHEEMLVLNAYTSRDDCVLLQHMDAFNQTCGRNLGYRRKNDAKHYLLINPRLFEFLVTNTAFAYSRYEIVLHLTKKQRVRIRAAA